MTAQTSKRPLSAQLVASDLPGVQRDIPWRALVLSVAALGLAAWGAISSPEILAGYDALSWLLILIPAFLLAYYRGWRGATRALAGGTLLVLLAELTAEHAFGFDVDWILLFLVAVVLLGVGLGLGLLSEFLERERREALLLAYSDPVTGLPNLQLLNFVLSKQFAAAQRGHPLCVVLFDVDRFGAYCDRHGHAAGEEALQKIAECLDRNMRHMNIAGRYDGDRFLSVLSGELVDGAWIFADRTREMIGHLRLPTGARLRISAGIASYEPWMGDPRELIASAERALRRAKWRGGNRTICETAYAENGELLPNLQRVGAVEQASVEPAGSRDSAHEVDATDRQRSDGLSTRSDGRDEVDRLARELAQHLEGLEVIGSDGVSDVTGGVGQHGQGGG